MHGCHGRMPTTNGAALRKETRRNGCCPETLQCRQCIAVREPGIPNSSACPLQRWKMRQKEFRHDPDRRIVMLWAPRKIEPRNGLVPQRFEYDRPEGQGHR